MKRIEWTESAIADLYAVRTYLSPFGAEVAQETIDILVLAARWLAENPQAGPALGYRRWRKWKPRRVRYLLIYEPLPHGIVVVRVPHERNDWKSIAE